MEKKKRIKKKKIIDGVEMFRCPDCNDYLPKSEMSKSSRQKDGIGNYCKYHRNLSALKSRRKNIKRKNENCKLSHRVSNEHKYYFKGRYRIKSVSVRPRATGVCENWGKPRYERRVWIDE